MEEHLDLASQASYFLDCRFNDQPLASGTAFFVERSGQLYLITNWHNVTGRNPVTMEYMSDRGAIPNNLNVHVLKNEEMLDWDVLNVPLFDDEENPLWLEHPTLKQKVDVVALKVELPAHLAILTIENAIEPLNESTPLYVGNDVFILGFPFGMTGGEMLPIWKRASLATEPLIDQDGLPKMYVDTASRPGMSGSPVILKIRRQATILQGDKWSRNQMRFVGIYSGRIGSNDQLQAQLGIVWKASVVDEIINQSATQDDLVR
jgi:Trypsin-like peptidase domain